MWHFEGGESLGIFSRTIFVRFALTASLTYTVPMLPACGQLRWGMRRCKGMLTSIVVNIKIVTARPAKGANQYNRQCIIVVSNFRFLINVARFFAIQCRSRDAATWISRFWNCSNCVAGYSEIAPSLTYESVIACFTEHRPQLYRANDDCRADVQHMLAVCCSVLCNQSVPGSGSSLQRAFPLEVAEMEEQLRQNREQRELDAYGRNNIMYQIMPRYVGTDRQGGYVRRSCPEEHDKQP